VSRSRQVTGTASVVLAPNPGPMTLEGTNSWVLRAPDQESCIVVDPGPLHEGHLAALVACGPVAVILLTHGHADHSAGAARLAELTGAAVRALDPAHRLGGSRPGGSGLGGSGLGGSGLGGSGLGGSSLGEGDVVAAAGLEVRVLATPGHTSDSLSLLLDDAVLTGDTVLGRGSTVVAHPDGVLSDYLRSLERLRELGDRTVLPGHGPELAAAGAAAEHYLAHRRRRLEQVRAAVAAGASSPGAVLATVYADVDRTLWPAAELSVRAQLAYLAEQERGRKG